MLFRSDKYATADSSMKAEIQVDATGKVAPQAPRTPAGDTSRRQQPNDNKRKAMQPASTSRQVATVEDQQPEGQPPPKRQKGCKPNWLAAFSYEQTLDAPCKSTAARSRPTTPLENAVGSPELPRVTDSCLLRLPAHRLLLPSSRRFSLSAPYKTSIPKSMELMSCSPAWPTISTTEGNDNKK